MFADPDGCRDDGVQATGGYEQILARALAAAGLETVVHQPGQVKAFARFKGLRVKIDKLNARLIAQETAQIETVRATADPRLAALAERMTAYQQASDLVAQIKTQMEHLTLPDLIDQVRTQPRSLTEHKKRLAAELARRAKAHPDLGRKLELARSILGVGPAAALALIIRMPELGALKRGQPAALRGMAPFARDSGLHKGQRRFAGGRRRTRRLLYMVAFSAKRWCPEWRRFAERLAANGKAHKQIVTAFKRNLIEAANLVFKRDRPWTVAPA